MRKSAPVSVILEGGPADLTSRHRMTAAVEIGSRLKIPFRNGYEHFELAFAGTDERQPPRFRWTMRTKIAE